MSATDFNTVTISSHNHSFAQLNCDFGIIREISDRYTFKPEGYQFTPAYKAGAWNGEIRLVDLRSGLFPKGLVPDVIDSLEASGYTVKLSKGDFKSFAVKHDLVDIPSLKLGFEPYDYQIAGAKRILEKKRQVILSPTGSGKSLMLYLLVRSLPNQKTLIIVPTISLVSQLFSDFKDYSKNNGWDVDANVHTISEGAVKVSDKNVTISTWQSLFRQPASFFSKYESAFVDECLHPSTSITMGDGSHKQIDMIQVGDIVKTTNEMTGDIENKHVIKVHSNLSVNEQMYEVETEDGVALRITGNHKVLTQRGWVRADELTLSDSINSIS